MGLLAEDSTLQKPSIFLGRVQVHEQTFAVTICMENPEIPGVIQMECFIPLDIFREKTLPFSRFSRNDQNFLYHLCGLLLPGFKWTESDNFTGIL